MQGIPEIFEYPYPGRITAVHAIVCSCGRFDIVGAGTRAAASLHFERRGWRDAHLDAVGWCCSACVASGRMGRLVSVAQKELDRMTKGL